MPYLLLFVGGALLCNALPHLISGLRGEAFYTPWARPRGIGRSSALQNFLWGAGNLFVAVFLIERYIGSAMRSGIVALALGFLAAGIGLSVIFGRRNRNRGASGEACPGGTSIQGPARE